jgi:RNA polymerase sigma-70 factor (ECF subfamily)
MPAQSQVDWTDVVGRIQRSDPTGEEILYRTLAGGARFFLQRRLGTQDVEDVVHDLFLTIVQTIRRGEIQHPERLMGFVRTLLYRCVSREVGRSGRAGESDVDVDTVAEAPDSAMSPEERAIAAEKTALMTKVLREMSDRDFEVLSRFYIREQSPEQVCAEMGITQVQFQLLKSRAKARLAELMRRKLGRGPTSQR